jgi:hypothetical protein
LCARKLIEAIESDNLTHRSLITWRSIILSTSLAVPPRGSTMRYTTAVFALTLALGIGTPANPRPHQQDALQGKVGVANETDLWRHYLLHVAADGRYADRDELSAAKEFRSEFEKAIDDFNASQETRVEADQIAALKGFIAKRDAMVEVYKKEIMSALVGPERRAAFENDVLTKMPVKSLMKSSGVAPATGENCGLPNSIACSITYSIVSGYLGVPGTAEVGPLKDFSASPAGVVLTMNQILDGAATMPGNSHHARHTPTVTMTIDRTPHRNSGKSVCANCYLYVNANVPMELFSGPEAQPKSLGLEGSVVCSEAGEFFDVGPSWK